MTIYQKIKRIAAPVVRAYQTDLTTHDRRACRQMKDGDTAVWCCRECGTHFIWIAQAGDTVSGDTLESLRNALNWFDAVADVFGNEDGCSQWYLLEKIGDAVVPMSASKARELFVRRIKALELAIKNRAERFRRGEIMYDEIA
ncbi:MAG: hypothetical protein ACR2RE_14645 [Geminicoccaceae bacterium]